MIRIPFLKRETRDADGYTDLILTALADASAGGTARPNTLALTETIAGLWGRAFASASVDPDTPTTRALTPDTLAFIGRQLFLRGESVHEISVNDSVELVPATNWTVTGSRSWTYALDIATPDATIHRTLDADRVLHLRYAVDPNKPWEGIGPLETASTTGTLAANTERHLSDETGTARGYALAAPKVDKALQRDLTALKGRLTLVASSSDGWKAGPDAAPRRDYNVVRIGATPPETLVDLRTETARSLLAAGGVPPALVENADGTAAREAWRRFLHSTIQPIGRIIAVELADKLDAPGLAFSFDRLFASDISGRARAFQSLVGGGMDVTKAATLAGLLDPD